jgi:integrase
MQLGEVRDAWFRAMKTEWRSPDRKVWWGSTRTPEAAWQYLRVFVTKEAQQYITDGWARAGRTRRPTSRGCSGMPAAGLPRRPFHKLRHTAASLLLAHEVDIRVVQQVLGHSQISLTANLYAHVLPALLQDAAARMDAVLAPQSSTQDGSLANIPGGA